VAELALAEAWLLFVCHWQTIYSDGSREGLKALDEVAARLARAHGPRLLWLTLSEIARYGAASEGCDMSVQRTEDGWMVELEAAFDCPDFTISLTTLEHPLKQIELMASRDDQLLRSAADGRPTALSG
jgi:hypothetical protein